METSVTQASNCCIQSVWNKSCDDTE